MNQLECFRATVAHEPHECYLFQLGFVPDLARRVQEHYHLAPGESFAQRFGLFTPGHVGLKPPAEKKWEAHRNYLDIQYVAEGREVMGWAPVGRLTPAGPYNPEKDVINFQEAEASPVQVEKGGFALFYPEDGHQPGCQLGAAAKIRKIVVKVKV